MRLQLDQVALEPGAGALEAQREELRRKRNREPAEHQHSRATANAAPLSGAALATYSLWGIASPRRTTGGTFSWLPPGELPEIHFAGKETSLSPDARDAVSLSAWAAKRWNRKALAVPGLPVEPVNQTQRSASVT